MLQNRPCLHQSFSSSRRSINWYPRFTEFLSLSTIKGLQSSCLYQGFTEFPSLSKVYRVPVSIQGLQSSCLYPLSRVYRVPVSIKGLQSSRLYPGFTEIQSQYFPCFRQRERKEKCRKPLLHCSIFFFSMPCDSTQGFCSATRNWIELYKNLTILSSLDAYT